MKTIKKGFFKNNFIDFINPMIEETTFGKCKSFNAIARDSFYIWAGAVKKNEMLEIFDNYNCEGSFETYAYFYENGKVEFLIEYPYDLMKEDIIIEVKGSGVDEMKKILDLYNDKDFNLYNKKTFDLE